MNNYYKKAIWSIALVMGLYGAPTNAAFPPYIMQAEYSTDIDYDTPIAVFHNYVIIDPIGSSATPAPIRELRGAVIDGYHKDSAGLRYFSFDVDTRVNGSSVLKSDIIKCNDSICSTFDFFFDSLTLNLKDININAFTLDPVNGDLVFSLDSDTRINGSLYLASDLIRYDGTNFTLLYNSLSHTLTRYRNIDALDYTDNGKYLVSFANDTVVNDVYVFDIATGLWSIAFIPEMFGDDYNQVNISSLNVTTQAVPELIFSDGFE